VDSGKRLMVTMMMVLVVVVVSGCQRGAGFRVTWGGVMAVETPQQNATTMNFAREHGQFTDRNGRPGNLEDTSQDLGRVRNMGRGLCLSFCV